MKFDIAYDFLPKRRSLNASLVMDSFGVGFDQGRHVVAAGVELEPKAGQILFFTGPSGSGKSSLLRAVAARLDKKGAAVRWLDALELPNQPLGDALPLPVKEALDLLAACGLGEAQLLLRTPNELSEGQRYRFRLAFGLALLQFGGGGGEGSGGGEKKTRAGRLLHHPHHLTTASWLVAAEFTATLDRPLAKVVAFNLRKLVSRTGVGVLTATTHDDIADDLNPDLWIRCIDDGHIKVERRDVKKIRVVRERALALRRHSI